MKHSDEKIQQLIESYLNQEMNDLDRSRFEKMIHEDMELHDEVEFQHATIDAIKKERILALKAGLSQVPVSLWSLGLIEAAKIAAITAGIGLVSVGGYFGYQYMNSEPENAIVVQSETSQENIPQPEKRIENIPKEENSAEASENMAEPKAPNDFVAKPENANQPSQSPTFVQSGKAKPSNSIDYSSGLKNQNEGDVKEPGTKNLTQPTTQEILLPEDGITKKSSLESIHPEVVFKRNNRDNFHYQFSDSKLVLYADFNDKLYEVLELNQVGNKKLFLAYNGKFFGLDPSQINITPLEEVKDQNLITVLAEYQKRRN
jgi:hypothetical protein